MLPKRGEQRHHQLPDLDRYVSNRAQKYTCSGVVDTGPEGRAADATGAPRWEPFSAVGPMPFSQEKDLSRPSPELETRHQGFVPSWLTR